MNEECQENLTNIKEFAALNSFFSEDDQIKIELDISESLKNSIQASILKFGNIFTKENSSNLNKNPSALSFDLSSTSEDFNSQSVENSLTETDDVDSKFWCPSGVKFNPLTNEILVADTYNHRIKIVDAEKGNILKSHQLSYFDTILSKKNLITPRDLHFNSSGLLVVTDSSNHKCYFLNSLTFDCLNSFGEKVNLSTLEECALII